MTLNHITVPQLVERYTEYKVLRPATIINYQKIGTLFIDGINLPNIDIAELSTDHIIAFRSLTLSRAKPVTWNNYFRHLKALFNFAVKMCYMETNPCADPNLKARNGKPIKKVLNESQIRELIHFFQTSSRAPEPAWFWTTVLQTLYYTGIRRSQLVGLVWRVITESGV